MDKNLYVSYQCFKEQPDYGIIVKTKNGQEYFYQVMADAYKVVRHKWQDTNLIASLNKEDIICHISLKDYMVESALEYNISDPRLFLQLTKEYPLAKELLDNINSDINKSSLLDKNTRCNLIDSLGNTTKKVEKNKI